MHYEFFQSSSGKDRAIFLVVDLIACECTGIFRSIVDRRVIVELTQPSGCVASEIGKTKSTGNNSIVRNSSCQGNVLELKIPEEYDMEEIGVDIDDTLLIIKFSVTS
jgi:hypothetical protein